MTNRDKIKLNYFSDQELKKEEKFAEFRTKWLNPLLRILDKLKVKPDQISYFALMLLIPFSIYFVSKPILATILVWLYVLLDGVDGSLARYQNTSNNGGSFTDIICDQMGLVVIVYNFIFFNFLDMSIGYWYAFLYIVMIVLSVIQNALKIKMQLLIRTKYVAYLMYSIWAFVRFDSVNITFLNLEITLKEFFGYPLIVFSLIMLYTNLISYNRLKSYLAEMNH